MLEAITLNLKSNTSREWVKEKLIELGFKEAPIIPPYRNQFYRVGDTLAVAVCPEDKLRYSRAINLISPQISVSRA